VRVRLVVPLLAALVFLAGTSVPAQAAAVNSLGLAATYDVSAKLRWSYRKLRVTSTASVTNGTEESVTALSFNLLPAKIGSMVLGKVLVDEAPAETSVGGQTLTVSLPEPLDPEQGVNVVINYSARFNTTTTDKNWMFAKLNGVVTAFRWIPWLSRAVKFKRPNFGDPFVTASSPKVTVSLTSDRTLKYATTGKRKSVSGLTQTFVARDVRDFNFSASPHYRVAKGTSGDTKIRVFYRSLPADVMMRWAKRSLARFSEQVGAYPYPFFVVAETEGGSGMESPGLIWIPRSTRRSNLPYLVAHETAHQWFYAVIGSDQAREPFAEEAPADFLARHLLDNRRASKCAKANLDGTVYDYSAKCYYEVIYIQGGNYLNRYRKRVGNSAFWAGLRAYYREYRFGLGGTRQLLDALDAAAPPGLAGGHAQRFPRYYGGK
jgi:hypothetical protein